MCFLLVASTSKVIQLLLVTSTSRMDQFPLVAFTSRTDQFLLVRLTSKEYGSCRESPRAENLGKRNFPTSSEDKILLVEKK